MNKEDMMALGFLTIYAVLCLVSVVFLADKGVDAPEATEFLKITGAMAIGAVATKYGTSRKGGSGDQ